ncbi:helix-turn-helix domain-containing protein [Streptomyces sp. NPDC059224]|uniref:helix-turn-helix domain-containing protein n=1 Tax=Streptomyces sp. NPDC059224 TaxID=3346775 RepID=UPI0036AB5B3A
MPQATPGTFAAELRRLRGQTSLRVLAQRANCGKSIISDLEHQRRPPTPWIAAALDKALTAGGTLVALAEAERQRASDRAGRTAPDIAVDGLLGLLRDWDDVLRRDFLKTTSTAALLAAGLPTTPRLDADSHDLLQAHQDLRAAHGRLDNLQGAGTIHRQAVDHHHQITAWLATATGADRQRVAALASDTGGFVAFLTYDIGQPELAAAHYRDAALHARDAGDISACTYLLGQMSRILTDIGQYPHALALTDRALSMAGTHAHPAVRSWLHAVRAHHHACLGNHHATDTDLRTAWTLCSKADDGEKPPYIGYLDAAELNKWTGHALVRLITRKPNLASTGKTALDAARAAWPTTSIRGSAEVLTSSARIYHATGDADTAIHLADQAVAVATRTGSARNLRTALAAQARASNQP